MPIMKNLGVGLCLCILVILCSSSRVVPQRELTNLSVSVAPPVQPKAKKQQQARQFKLFSKKQRLKKQKEGNPKYNFLGIISIGTISLLFIIVAIAVLSPFFWVGWLSSFLTIFIFGAPIISIITGILCIKLAKLKILGWIGLILGGIILIATLGLITTCIIQPNCTVF